MCGELDHPDFAHDERERRIRLARIKIFRQWGNIILEDLDYFEPYMIQGRADGKTTEDSELEPDRMLLYLFPIQPITQPTPEMMAHLASGILLDNYRLDDDSWFVQKALASVNHQHTVQYNR